MAQPFHVNDFHAAAGKAGNDGFLFEVLDCPRQCSAMDAEHGSELFLRHAERELIGTPFKAEGNEKAAETGDEIIHEHVSEIRMVGEDQRAEQLDNGKHEVGIPGGENGIMQYLSRNLPDHGVGHALILPGCLTPGGRGSEVEDASRFKVNDRTHPAVDRVKNHMDFPFINIKEIETGFALNLDDASGGVALLGAKMQYLVPCRSHVSDLWNGKWGEQGQLAG